MSAQQQLVAAAGVGLVAANVWTERVKFSGLLGDGDLDQAHKAAKEVGVELIGVAALVLLAGTGTAAGNAAFAAIAALWIVYLMRRTPSTGAGHTSTLPPSMRPGTAY